MHCKCNKMDCEWMLRTSLRQVQIYIYSYIYILQYILLPHRLCAQKSLEPQAKNDIPPTLLPQLHRKCARQRFALHLAAANAKGSQWQDRRLIRACRHVLLSWLPHFSPKACGTCVIICVRGWVSERAKALHLPKRLPNHIPTPS